jgi:hypothetical protein
MAEYPPTWTIFSKEDFALACPRDPGELGVELMAITRPNGRLQDHYRLAVGGSRSVSVTFSTRDVFVSSVVLATMIQLHVRPADIKIRRNLTTSEWYDIFEKLKSRDLTAFRLDVAEDDTEDLVELLNQVVNKEEIAASYRWVVAVSPDGHLELLLQSLPASAKNLNSKPIFKG